MTSQKGMHQADIASEQISIRDVLTIVFKRRKLIFVFAVTVVIVVVTAVLLLPRQYEVTATLLVNRSRAEIPMAPSESSQLIVSGSEQDLNAEIEVFKSRALFEEVAEILAPIEPELRVDSRIDILLESVWSFVLGGSGSDLNELVIELLRDIQVNAISSSNAISIRYESEDPEWATQAVSTLTERYLDRRTSVFQSPEAVNFFEQQMNEAENTLTDLEDKIEELAAGSSITIMRGPRGTDSLAAQKSLAMDRLAEAESELGDAEVELESQQLRLVSLRSQLEREPERNPTASRNSITAASEEIEIGLAELRLRRDELLQDFKPDSRYVRDIETQISLAEDRLAQGNAASAGVNRTETNPIYLQLKGELLRVETDLEGSKSRVETLKSHVRIYRNELNQLNENSFALDDLRRNAQVAEENFLLYRKKFEEARISTAMDQQRIINVTVAEPAQMPLEPMRRGLVKKAMLALFVGVFGGLGLAFVLELYVNQSFKTASDIERRLGIPHLASIPLDVRTG